MADRLKDKTAIVFGVRIVGAGLGNGKAAAVAFAREGARVACVDLAEAAAAETASFIQGEGGTALSLAADVMRIESISPPPCRKQSRILGLSIFCITMWASLTWAAPSNSAKSSSS